jgi:DedD protein
MDSRAKQRLTGAVILVALFVLLVPELLTGPKSGNPPAATPGEEGMRRYTIDLDAPAGTAQPMSASEPAAAVALPPVAENPMSGTPERAQAGESAQTETPVATPMTAAPQAPPATNPVPDPTPSVPVTRPAAPVASNPPAAKPVTPSPTAVPKGSFAVQLGSFNVKDNADRLVRDMTAKGFNAYVAPITSGGRELYRVRVGPTRDRASAEALAAQLRRMGQTGSIVPIS